MSSDSDSSSQKDKKATNKRTNSPISRQKSFQSQAFPSEILLKEPSKQIVLNPVPVAPVIQDQTGLYEQNRKLRRKLKELSIRLDEELQKAAQNKLKQQNLQKNFGRPVPLESQPLELQNAYKMIERLQKTVHDYESKESYQITLKRVMDLEGIIKKKQAEIDELKTEIKTLKKMAKDKERHIEVLIDNSKKMNNPAEDLQVINKLKVKLKKFAQQNDQLRKKQLEKHEKLVKAEHRIIDLEQNSELPIGKEEGLLQQIEEGKKKYKQIVQRLERQNIYIAKLNEKLSKETHEKSRRSGREEDRQSERTERKLVARSLQDLPPFQKKINTSQLLAHLPSPKQGVKLKRY